MASALGELKHEWHRFVHDPPGKRFCNHRERSQHKSRKHAAATFALGVLLLIGGVALLFFPGPGIPLIVFGLALVATHSERLAGLLDRGEPRVRSVGRRALHWWKGASRMTKAALVSGGLFVACGFLFATWRWVVSAYLL